jgi:AraC-like DNA-binding protein
MLVDVKSRVPDNGPMLLTRAPGPWLRPYVRSMWAMEPAAAASNTPPREHVLPTGDMHLVFRLSGPPLRLFAGTADAAGHTVGYAIVGGARSTFYARDVSVPTRSVGAQLRPGAARALFGLPADELAERHTPLDALWGPAAAHALERIHAAGTLEAQLDVFEALLAERLRSRPQAMHPAIAQALARLGGGAPIGELVTASGYSHRRFISLFRDAAGLPPKRLERVLRVQRVTAAWAAGAPALPWVDLALQAGYSDQPHFNRDFLEITGMTPLAYARASPASPNHVRA